MSLDLMAYKKALDECSGRIRECESLLSESGLRITMATSAPGIDGSVLWTLGEPNRWRLCYEGDGERRILIECPGRVRLMVRPLLEALMQLASVQAGRAARGLIEGQER